LVGAGGSKLTFKKGFFVKWEKDIELRRSTNEEKVGTGQKPWIFFFFFLRGSVTKTLNLEAVSGSYFVL